MITFVTFHAEVPGEDIEQSTPLDQNNLYDYQQAIDLMFKSVDKFHSNCEKVILTDLDTNVSFFSLDITVQRYPVDSRTIMLSRLVSQLHFLKSHEFKSDIVFLDSDILVNDNIESLFSQEFDLALTVRDDKEMPINGGVIYISKRNKEAVVAFFEKLYLLYTEKYIEKSQWWGDQHALADAINWQKGSQVDPGNIEIDSIKILLLSCDIYNFSPDYESDLDVYELKERKVLHFKGPRKKYMNVYWRNYLHLYGSDDWEQEKSLLKQQVVELQNERLNLKSTIKNLQSENTELRRFMKSKVNSLRAENEVFAKNIQELNENLKKNIQELNENLKKNIQELKDDNANLEKNIQELNENLQKNIQELTENLEKNIQKLKDDNINLKKSIQELNGNLDRSIQELNENLAINIQELKDDNANLKKNINELKDDIVEIKKSNFWKLREQYLRLKHLFINDK
ncbi:hypothetical protein HUN01_24920 [Nostoc edaphicum CCNP1411]|uniref:Nucleotide-diphospho-sugar transferase domain-containing protein n=1 Tax=Nostoc edaphicum CCNP1411 TaxID=1472755 RepID=A0A7D7R6Y2_9NOSO|nr:hypothetical protein [Nostoc edaphicum]QMS90666.1 hypothetical protein HUN01_24920 [Nostoc edaphicum CCNP1411]